jgi:polysaccharide biosynthesis protein PslG
VVALLWRFATVPIRARALLLRVLLACTVVFSAMIIAPALAGATTYGGVQLHSLWWDSTNTDMDQELALSAQAHSNIVRVDVGWASLETGGKGQFDANYVAKLDRFVAGASAKGMKVLITLLGTPCWASSAPATLKGSCPNPGWVNGVVQYAPTNMSDYADIARWITSRYGNQMAALEVWNEPNNSSFWVSGAAAYAALVRAAYPAAKAGNANVPVIAGSLAGADTTFLNTLYSNGIKGSEDGIAVHPYAEARGFPGLVSVHSAMLAAGDNVPVWVTEFGWPTGTDPTWHVSEADQATNITNGFNDLNALPWVKASVLYNLRDKGTDPTVAEDNYGVINRDYTLKPGYQALTDVLAHTAGVAPAAAPAPAPAAAAAPTAPTVTLTSPANRSTIGSSVSVAATASDAVGVTKVTFAVDSAVRATVYSAPYAATFSTKHLANGVHTITATAYDAAGLTASSTVTVGKGITLTATAVAATVTRLQLRLVNRAQAVFAMVSAPSGSTVVLTVSRCTHRPGWVTQTGVLHGRLSKRLGRRARMAGCQVSASLARRHVRAVSARVR